MAVTFIEPTVLYNYLSQHSNFPNTSNTNYLLLLDCRTRDEFNESHVILAKHVRLNEGEEEFAIPYEAELECKENVVVYDGNTSDYDESRDAIRCAQLMANNGSKNLVQVINGGYERFSALYPFLRTQKTICVPRELDDRQTYPFEVIPGKLYLGDAAQACFPHVMKDLKIKAHVKCTVKENPQIEGLGHSVIKVPLANDLECNAKDSFNVVITFIAQQLDGSAVRPTLIYCDDGKSCSPVFALAFLMSQFNSTLSEAWKELRRAHSYFFLNRNFTQQLLDFEEVKFHKRITDPDVLQD